VAETERGNGLAGVHRVMPNATILALRPLYIRFTLDKGHAADFVPQADSRSA
jgi:hypothetical protein